MTRREIEKALEGLPYDAPVSIVVKQDNEDDPIEDGAVLDIVDSGFVQRVGDVFYARRA